MTLALIFQRQDDPKWSQQQLYMSELVDLDLLDVFLTPTMAELWPWSSE